MPLVRGMISTSSSIRATKASSHACSRRQRLGRSIPRSPATSPAQYPAGSGVGVSVLLREPHRFEGLSAIPVKREAHDLASLHCEHGRDISVHLHSAGLAAGLDMVGYH